MSLVVEDGTGLANAESYGSVADADTYFAARGNATWAAISVVADKEAALRRATDYMLQAYRLRWAGTRNSGTQALDWPRYNVPVRDAPGGYGSSPYYLPNTAVPAAVKQACFELAVRASAEDLLVDLDQQIKSETVGPTSTVYDTASPQGKRYPAVDAILRPLLSFAGGIRAVRC